MPRYPRIPTGRTWRDLPSSPPTTFVPAPVLADEVAEPETRRLNVWPFVAGGLAVILVGFIVGLLLPRDSAAEQDLGAPSTESLPDVIIPPAPDLPEQSSTTVPDMTPAPIVDEIFGIPSPPTGWQIVSNFTQASSDRVDQMIILSNGLTEIRVSAFAAATEPELPIGDGVTVRGEDGVMTQPVNGRFVVSWIEPGKITFAIDAPDDFGLTDALELAKSLEIK
jgi:hypothetical protein